MPSSDEVAEAFDSPAQAAEAKLRVELHDLLAAHSALPYLFIGSGVSRRYLGLPDWSGLLRLFAEEIGEDFDFHLASANSIMPAAASSVAHEFHQHWWKDRRYKAQRDQFKTDVTDEEGALKVAIASYVLEHQDLAAGLPGVDDPALADEIALLRTAVIDGVITTNYDNLSDQLFPDFPPYVGQDELLMSDAQFIAEAYKIHGSATRPQTLILTAADYTEFSRRNHYLAAKLLTIFAEHPVVFVGYSLNDEYIGEILGNIATAVGSDRLGELGDRIYFVEWNSDPDFVPTIERTSIERAFHRLPITRIESHSLGWLWSAMNDLERPFPAAVLRELRKHVFDLVAHPDPEHSREVVRAIPMESTEAGTLRVVFGVGAFTDKDLQDLSTISGRALTLADIERDVLGIRKRALDAENVLVYGIPEGIRPSSTQFLPVHKYLAETKRIDSKGRLSYKGLPDLISKLAVRPITPSASNEARFARDVKGKYMTPREIMDSDLAAYFKLECLTMLDPATVDIDELRQVLVEFYESADFAANVSPFRKALCAFDRIAAQALAKST